jgi:hypothetical protein
MDRCVERVMARDGVSKQRAIAVCHSSIAKEEESVASARDRRKARRADARRAAAAEAAEKYGEHNEKRWGENSDPGILQRLAQPNQMTTAFRKSLTDRFGEDAVDAALEDASDASKVEPNEPPDDDPDLDPEPEPEIDPIEEPELEPVAELRQYDDEENEEDEEDEEDKPSPKKKPKKDVHAVSQGPYGGSTSWAEFDDYMEARDKSAKVRDVMWAFDMMIENIMSSPSIEPEEKAQAIAFLSEGFRARILSLKQDMNIIERVKAALGGARRNDLPDSAFAYIEPGGKKDESGRTVPRSLRHYPIQDKAHVGNALSRAAGAIKKGGKTAQIARSALPKIRAAAKRMGVGKPAEQKKGESGIAIFKGADGEWRWFGWASNKWRDRDVHMAPKHGGEILTSDAHREFVQWVDEDIKARAPELWLWHTPGTAFKRRADWIDFADGFLVASGPLEEKEAASLMALELLYDLAMSHGMHPTSISRDKGNGYITKYRTFEMSPLPRQRAANPWTNFATIVKEVATMGFNEEKRKMLVAAMGEDAVAGLEGQTGQMAKMLEQLGIDSKEADPTDQPEGRPKAKDADQPSPDSDASAAAIVKAIAAEFNLDGLSSFLKSLVERQEKLEAEVKKTTEQKLAEAITPVVSGDIGRIWDKRPSRSDGNVVKEGEPGSEAPSDKPEDEGEFGWVAQEIGLRADVAAPASPVG